jgi:hypothetical protein
MAKEERLELRLDTSLKEWLREYSETSDCSVSGAMRRAVEYFRKRTLMGIPPIDPDRWVMDGSNGAKYEHGRLEMVVTREKVKPYDREGYRCRIRVSFDSEWPELQPTWDYREVKNEERLLELDFVCQREADKGLDEALTYLADFWNWARSRPVDEFNWK